MTWKESLCAVLDDRRGQGIVTSPDVDGLTSACVIGATHGMELIGIYTTRYLILFDGATAEHARDAVWLDHDVSNPETRCIGQHLVHYRSTDKLPLRCPVSFNPNAYFGQDFANSFKGIRGTKRDKYPFGTVHALVEGIELSLPNPGDEAFALLAHADGSWGTCVDYPHNTAIWQQLMFKDSQFFGALNSSAYTESETNLKAHKALLRDLADAGVSAGRSRERDSQRISGDWDSVQGRQTITFIGGPGFTERALIGRFEKSFQKVRKTLQLVGSITGWRISAPARITGAIAGDVKQIFPNQIPNGEFDAMMLDLQLFSHAFKGFSGLRYTRGILNEM